MVLYPLRALYVSIFFVICTITKSSQFSDRCFEENVGNRPQTISAITGEEETVFFSVCLNLFFLLHRFKIFFEILCYFLETLFGNITPSQAKLTGQMSTSSPTSPHPHFHHPFYTPVLIMCFSRAPGIVCYPIIIYIGCEKGKCYPFILLETPPKMGYPLPACAKEQVTIL